MTLEYTEVETSREVVSVIYARHEAQLTPHASYSNPDGTCPLGNGRPQMDTWYGFRLADCPLYHIRTTWDRDLERKYERLNEKHEYWLCIPKEQGE